MEVAGRLGYMLALLGVGVFARRAGLVDATRRDRLNWFGFYVALPALVFVSTYDQPIGAIASAELLVGVVAVLFAVVAASLLVHRRTAAASVRSVAVVQSYHSNFGYLGLPLVAATLGTAAAATASIVLGLGSLLQVTVTVLVLVSMNDAEASVGRELRSVVTNPVLIALGIGVAFSLVGQGVPGPLLSGLDLLASTAFPLALLLVGASIRLEWPEENRTAIAAVVALKVLVTPALAWAAFTLLAVDPVARAATVVMFATPTAVSTYIYAAELGGDAEFASVGIFATTVVSVGTLGALLALV